MFAQVTFDIAYIVQVCQILPPINYVFCLFVNILLNKIKIFTQLVNGIVCIVWDKTFRTYGGQTSQMDTGIGVIFQRTNLILNFIVLMRILTDANSKELYKCSVTILYRTTVATPVTGVRIDKVWWVGYFHVACQMWHKPVFVSENIIIKNRTLSW